MKKKIALITCFLDNYGACLQALALQTQIKNLGCDCDIIAYIGNFGYSRDTFWSVLKMNVVNHFYMVWNFFHGDGKTGPYTRRLVFHNFRKKYLRFEKYANTEKIKYYNSIDEMYALPKKYDVFVCGSDQIWNPCFYGENHPVHFLRFVGNKKRIAYAPSIGLSELPSKYHETFIEYIKDFDSVSVREIAGSEIIRDLCSREAKVVLDPTLLIGSEYWNHLIKSVNKTPYEKYVFCYIFSDNEKCSKYLKSVQEKTKLPIVYVNVSKLRYDSLNAYCANDKSPIEFLELLKNSEFVVTDSFHGTAFSLLFNKDFYVFKRKLQNENINMISRIESVVEIAGLKSRFCSIDEEFDVKPSIDYAVVNKRLDDVREDSLEFLREAIMGEE